MNDEWFGFFTGQMESSEKGGGHGITGWNERKEQPHFLTL
jgi:hypothetical protein